MQKLKSTTHGSTLIIYYTKQNLKHKFHMQSTKKNKKETNMQFLEKSPASSPCECKTFFYYLQTAIRFRYPKTNSTNKNEVYISDPNVVLSSHSISKTLDNFKTQRKMSLARNE